MNRSNFYIRGLKTQFGLIFDFLADMSYPVAEVYCSKMDDMVFEVMIRLATPVKDLATLQVLVNTQFVKCDLW